MNYCIDPEGWKAVSRLRAFDLTPCFEEGIILPAILVVFFALSVLRSWSLNTWRTLLPVSQKSKRTLLAEIILLGASCLTSFATLIFVFATHIRPHVPVWQTLVLEPLALLAGTFLAYVNQRHSRTSSTLLLIFWPLYTLAFIIWARTYILTHSPPLSVFFIVKSTVIVLGLVSFSLECLATEHAPSDKAAEEPENPTVTANVFSIWSFGWMTPLMKKGTTTIITENDLWPLLPSDESAVLGDDLEKARAKHKRLWLSLFNAYGKPYGMAAMLKILQDLLAFLQPQLLRWLLSYIAAYQSARFYNRDLETARPTPFEGFSIAIIMFMAAIAQTILLHQYFQRCFETGMRVRAGLVSAIYKKALVLSNDERGRSTGDIVNLMSVDATRLQDLCTYGLIAISGPLQITLAFVSLYNLLGWPAFVGVAIMIFSIPLNTFIASILKRMQEQQMKNRDERTRLMSELLANIKSIKLYAWEFTFIRKVLFVRNEKELKMLRKIGVATSLNMAMWGGIPLLVAFSSFAVASATKSSPLTSDIIFPSISLFMLLQFPLAMFSQVTSNLIEAWVSVKRVSDFLNADELQHDARSLVIAEDIKEGDEVLSIRDGEFSWSKNAVAPALQDISLTVRKGELVGVLGKVGAGKTSLLSAIVGDMHKTEGSVSVAGSVAYAPQNPWIMSATVRDNILFSHKYEEEYYEMVLEACALKPDLAILSKGDLTEVGEKGITLSGGQRARVSLARAVYARADLVLLDDVLAAVDSHVAKHLFDHAIGPRGLLANRARVLVTHSIAFIRHCDTLLYIRRGVILDHGSYDQLMDNTDSHVYKLVKGHGVEEQASGTSTPFIGSGSATPSTDNGTTLTVSSITKSLKGADLDAGNRKAILSITPPKKSTSAGLSTEHSEQGKVKWTVYKQYINAASKTGFALFLLFNIVQQVVSVLSTLTLRTWSDHNQETGDSSKNGGYLLAYGLFSLSSTVFGGIAGIIIWVLCSLRSSKALHEDMLHAVMRAPLSFFEVTPTGRILNLFSRDTYVVDSILARVISGLVRTTALCGSILVVIGVSFPPFLLAVVPLAWFYRRVMIYYLATSRELKRLDATSKSPIFAWFSESLAGVATIRAFNQQQIFIASNQNRIDRNQMCYLPSVAVNRWLAIRLEFVGATIILIAAFLAIFSLMTSGIDAGLVGLVLSYAINTTSSLNWVVRMASEVEQNIVSVERILYYVELSPEAPYEISEAAPGNNWPLAGEVVFSEYSTRYRPELDLVLRNINMSIKPREKIGVCGRTGAGKSSLLLALFRVVEPANGTIYIDGIDITKIGLHDLRSAMSIVPQSPDLFQGSLRENIDPVGEHTDADIWAALDQAHLKRYIESLSEGLDARVTEGGQSLSAGQKQLLCFARALLRKSKILVLDEATSAVDLDTDKAIQAIIRSAVFEDVTMFTIAHRLNTIMESDRILVLDSGKVAEFDTPQNLLSNPTSVFRSLAVEAGLVGEADGSK